MISVAAYLENEKVADVRSEYVNGRCLPVVGACRRHDQICMRLAHLLTNQLTGSAFRLYRPTVKAYIQGPPDERFYYPDLQIGPAETAEHPDFLDSPRVIIEVLSPVSAQRDREEKASAYCRIEALDELVLVAHDAIQIEVWRRGNHWVPEAVRGADTLRLASIGAEIPLGWVFTGLPPAAPGPGALGRRGQLGRRDQAVELLTPDHE